jgi:cytochrome c oxidase subunit 2
MKPLLRALAALFLTIPIAGPAISRQVDDPPSRTVEITARRFEFEPKQITLKKGEAVTLAVTSQDVKHGFFSRPLGFDADLVPGQTEQIHLEPREAGSYTVICDHYCGSGHGGMKMTIVVE